jgi:spoIIIJ-associated protein
MDLLIEMNISEKDNRVYVDLKGPEVGLLIGRRGETMEALQFLVNLQVNKNNSTRKKVFIDIEGYRGRREETLQRLALKLANKAKQKGKAVVLEPMSAQERRIIHTALQVRSDIYTFSEGEEPYRKVVISPRNRRSSI